MVNLMYCRSFSLPYKVISETVIQHNRKKYKVLVFRFTFLLNIHISLGHVSIENIHRNFLSENYLLD